MLQLRPGTAKQILKKKKNTRTSQLPSPAQTHRAETRRTSPAWTCRGCGRTSLDPENWSLSRRIWSHGWYCRGEGAPRCSLDLDLPLPPLRRPQTLCPAGRGKKDLVHVLYEGPIQHFSGGQALLPVLFILSHPFNESASSFSFSHSYLSLCCIHAHLYFLRTFFGSLSCPLTIFIFLIFLKILLSLSAFCALPLSASLFPSFAFSFFPNLSCRYSTHTQYIILTWQTYQSILSPTHPPVHPSLMPPATSTSHLAVAGHRCGALEWHLRIPLRRQWGFSTPWNPSPWTLAGLLFWRILGQLRVVKKEQSISRC